MKKLILTFLLIPFMGAVYASPEASLGMHIANNVNSNKYYLCLYEVGCMSIKAGNKGKIYPMPAIDVGNILRFVITDVDNMKMYMQVTNQSCNVKLKSGQKLTITGSLVVRNNQPSINNLRCRIV